MSKRLTKLNNIIEANIRLEESFLNEQKAGTAPTPAKDAKVKVVTKTLDSTSGFATGKADPDPKSKEFKEIVNDLINSATNPLLKKPIEVKVQGGASAVGRKNWWYDNPEDNLKYNTKLANKRQGNMISYLTQALQYGIEQKTGNDPLLAASKKVDLPSLIKFVPLPGVVGKATVKDSEEAKKEQFVKVTYPSTSIGASSPTTAVDTTATKGPGSKEQQMMDLKTKGMVPVGPKDDTEKIAKGMKSIVIRTSDGKTVYKFNQEQYNEINDVLKKYNMFMPSVVVTKPKAGGTNL